VKDFKRALEEHKATPTFVRLVQTALDPCWDWVGNRPRLRTARAISQALDRVERRCVQMCASERMADARFESMRMDLGAAGAQTGGTRYADPKQAIEKLQKPEQRLMDRQYLSHDGVAGRTQFERQRNASKRRLERGAFAASEYRAAKNGHASSAADDLEELEQRVEDQIQIAMAKGDFDKLEGRGQPLKRLQKNPDNPFLDRGDRVGYDLLQKHGYLPEWIEQQKGIRTGYDNAVKICASAWLACNEEPNQQWLAQRDAFQQAINSLNRRVRNYNLICPAPSQMPLFVFTEEIRKVRRSAREIMGTSQAASSATSISSAPSYKPPKRLMTPLSEVFKGSGSGLSPPPSGRSIWERLADAVAPKR